MRSTWLFEVQLPYYWNAKRTMLNFGIPFSWSIKTLNESMRCLPSSFFLHICFFFSVAHIHFGLCCLKTLSQPPGTWLRLWPIFCSKRKRRNRDSVIPAALLKTHKNLRPPRLVLLWSRSQGRTIHFLNTRQHHLSFSLSSRKTFWDSFQRKPSQSKMLSFALIII